MSQKTSNMTLWKILRRNCGNRGGRTCYYDPDVGDIVPVCYRCAKKSCLVLKDMLQAIRPFVKPTIKTKDAP